MSERHSLVSWLMITTLTLLWFGALAALLALAQVRVGFAGTARLPADCAVVFGATVHGREAAGPGITRRVETAARLHREGNVQRLIMTGGQGDTGQASEAAVMAALAEELGVPSSALRVESSATSTWENIQHSRPLIADCAAVIAVSDRYHLRRIQLLAGMQGFDLPSYPADQSAGAFFETRSLMRESLGVLYYSFLPVTELFFYY